MSVRGGMRGGCLSWTRMRTHTCTRDNGGRRMGEEEPASPLTCARVQAHTQTGACLQLETMEPPPTPPPTHTQGQKPASPWSRTPRRSTPPTATPAVKERAETYTSVCTSARTNKRASRLARALNDRHPALRRRGQRQQASFEARSRRFWSGYTRSSQGHPPPNCRIDRPEAPPLPQGRS